MFCTYDKYFNCLEIKENKLNLTMERIDIMYLFG